MSPSSASTAGSTSPLLDEQGNPLSEDQLAGMKYVIGRGGHA